MSDMVNVDELLDEVDRRAHKMGDDVKLRLDEMRSADYANGILDGINIMNTAVEEIALGLALKRDE